jgi:tryptophan-rich sensory protein
MQNTQSSSKPFNQSGQRVRYFGGLAFWLLLSFGVGFFGAQFETGAWYHGLAKPSWTPPGWLFGPVWTLLYIAMAVAAWIVSRKGKLSKVWLPLLVYIIQLVLNALWSWIFFGRQQIGLALADIICLLIVIVLTTMMFWKCHRGAGLLMLPYILWVAFATALNFEIWRLN